MRTSPSSSIAIRRLIDHAAATDARLEAFIARLRLEGVETVDAKVTTDKSDAQRLNRMLE